MKIPFSSPKSSEQGGSFIMLLIVMGAVVVATAAVSTLVGSASKVTRSRGNMVSAIEYAQAAATIACSDLDIAVQKAGGTLAYNLATGSNPYTATSNTVFQRTIAAPFSNQTATAKIILPVTNGSPNSAKIVATATVGGVTQTATVNVNMTWAYPAAIISTHPGTTGNSNDKGTGQDGNVSINGSGAGAIVVDGGVGKAVMANGRVNYDMNSLNPPASAYSMTNYGTAKQIPDYTAMGTSNALFDIKRFIAVASNTPSGYSPSGNNYFTNLNTFMAACRVYSNMFNKCMYGVVVVRVADNDPDLGNMTDTLVVDKKTGKTSGIPNGINIRGSLVLNFTGSSWDPVSEKIIVTAPININAANLSGLVATDPTTYTTGYPAVYSGTNASKNPVSIDITGKGFANFQAGDDFPALIYSTGCLDMHGNANICGVLYTPCYVELENKKAGQIQYIKGCVIMGHGIYYENNKASTSIISFDANTVDSLVTMGTSGKSITVGYWQ